MQSLNRRRIVAERVQYELRVSETQPNLIERLRAMTVPCEQKTPRGAPPSNWLKRKIVRAQNGGPLWDAIMAMLFLRKERGESVPALQAPLYTAAASLEGPVSEEEVALKKADIDAETASHLAFMVWQNDPTPANWERVQELEAIEMACSSRIVRAQGSTS